MATITPTITKVGNDYRPIGIRLFFEQVNEDDDPAAMNIVSLINEHIPGGASVVEVNLQIIGTVNGGSFSVSGSIDGTNYVASLVDSGGTAIALTAVGGATLRDVWPYLQVINDGNGTGEDVDIYVFIWAFRQ